MALRAEPIDRLRDDVRLLGELVGDVLREQGGAELFEAVEHVRQAAIELRSGRGSEDDLLEWAESQTTARLMQLVRAFSTYFHLINLAEQHHRIRTLRERERSQGGPLHESVAAAFKELADAGVPSDAIVAGLEQLEIHPVLTAHPSEARRRTLLHHLERAAELIPHLDDARVLEELRARITLIWQTAEARSERPSVLDEVQSVLYVLAGTVYDVLPVVLRSVDAAMRDSRGVGKSVGAREALTPGTSQRAGGPAIRRSPPSSRARRRDWRARPCSDATARRSSGWGET
jgi:phosphoenolpyruvate carboxylase